MPTLVEAAVTELQIPPAMLGPEARPGTIGIGKPSAHGVCDVREQSLGRLMASQWGVSFTSQLGARGTTTVVTSSLSLARELWRFGEPDLAARARGLSPLEVLEIGSRAGRLIVARAGKASWPDGPRGSEVVLAAIERLEGRPRPPRRRRRLPERPLPAELQATEEERWEAARPVGQLLTELEMGNRS